MLLGCNTLYTHGRLERSADFTVKATEESLAKLRGVGYQAVEYSHCGHFGLEEAHKIGQYARALGLQSWSCHAEGEGDFALGKTPSEAAQNLIHSVEVCGALGGRVVVVHIPVTLGLRLDDRADLNELMAFDLEALRPAQEKGVDLGLELALENGRTVAHMDYLLRVRERLGAPNVGICVDTGHANLGNLGAARAIRVAANSLCTTHLQDNLGQRDDHMPPGQGIVDWAEVFVALRQVGYAGPLMLELTDRPNDRPYDQDLELGQGLENTRRFVAQYLS